MSDMYSLLVAARSSDNATRNEGERMLREVESSNYEAYIVSLSRELNDESKPEPIRQFAGILMKNSLDSENDRTAEFMSQRWLSLPAASRDETKSNLVLSLQASVAKARMACAQAIAKVGKIEIPNKLWPEILEGLVATSTAAGVAVGLKAASVNTLGMICEEIMDVDVFEQPQIDAILAAIVTCMDNGEDPEVRSFATKALYNALDFAESNFKDENASHRDAIMAAICSRAGDAEITIRRDAFDCLTRVADIYYARIGPYIDHLADLTYTAATGEQEDVAVRAVEFWTAIAEEEIEYVDASDPADQHFVTRHLAGLVQMTTQLMSRIDEFNDDENYGVAQAAAVCLTSCTAVARDDIVPFVMKFITDNLSSSDWRVQDACTMAFGCILDGPTDEVLTEHINNALPFMISKINGTSRDPNAVLRESAAWTIAQTLANRFGVVDMATLFEPLLTAANESLDDEARVAAKAASIVERVAENIGQYEDKGSTPLSPYFAALADHLLSRSDASDYNERNLRACCFQALTTMIETSSTSEHVYLHSLLQENIRRLQLCVSASTTTTTEDDRRNIESQQLHCTAMLQPLIMILSDELTETAPHIVQLLLSVLDSKNALAAQEAFYALSTLGDTTENALTPWLHTICERLDFFLGLVNETDAIRAAVACAGSLARNGKAAFLPYVEAVATKLIDALKSPELARSVKPFAVAVFGDIASGVGIEHIMTYIEPIVSILQNAAASGLSPEENEQEDFDYLIQLRIAVADAWTCVFQQFLPDDDDIPSRKAEIKAFAKSAAPFALRVLPFISDWLASQAEASDKSFELVKSLVALAGDLVSIVGATEVRKHVNPSDARVNALISYLDKAEKMEHADSPHDADGNARTTIAQYFRKCLK